MENNLKKLAGVVAFEVAEVNDNVQFGKIAWKVIAIEDGKKLLLSKECISSAEVFFSDVKRPWLLRGDDTADYQLAVDCDGEIVKVQAGQVCDNFRPAVWVR